MQLTRTQKWYLGLGLLVLIILVTSKSQPEFTSNSTAPSSAPSPMVYGEAESMKTLLATDAYDRSARGSVTSQDNVAQTATTEEGSTEQRIIKQGDLSLLVNSVEETQASLQAIAKENKGFVRDASVYEQQDKTLSGYAVLRVEAARFESTMQAIRDLALNVERESITGTDVTEQFVDLEAQLKNARAEEQAYLALLNRAGSVSDLLEVQRELSNVRARIEMFEGRLKYLSNQTDLATISVNLSEKPSFIAPTGDFRLGDTIKEAFQTLVIAFQEIARGIVWLVIFGVGVVLPLGLLAWLGYRIWKRKTRR